jgi:hypothetical protein
MGYYWPTMVHDAHHFGKNCSTFLVHESEINAPNKSCDLFASPWSFSQCSSHLIGTISPPSSKGHKFIVTMWEYFTRWVEAMPLLTIGKTTISLFLFNQIIYKFNIQKVIITKNCISFCNDEKRELCQMFQTSHITFSPCYSQGNGQVVALKKTFVGVLTCEENNRFLS